MPGQHGRLVGTQVAQSGLGNDNDEKTFHSYYQWVPFMLFFQVIK
jgi:innexin